MILIDTSVWIDHFRKPVQAVIEALRGRRVVMHPFIIGELAAGTFSNWEKAIMQLKAFPVAQAVGEDAYFEAIRQHKLMGSALSFVDIHLIAATLANDGMRLLAHDRRLHAHAERLGCAYEG